MTLFHETWRRRVSLLASGALEGSERDATLAHLDGCPRCREERRALEAVLDLIPTDLVRRASPPIPLGALVARVQAGIDAAEGARALRTAAWARALKPLGAALAVALAVAVILRGPSRPPAEPSPPTTKVAVSENVLRRMEATMAREQAVRYLNEAQDVLVTVAAAPRSCDRKTGRVDVGDEARRSRELLARRALLVEMDRSEVASARPVLEDVERMLREVASLESCAREGELRAIHKELAERRLLMKIDLMTRELQG